MDLHVYFLVKSLAAVLADERSKIRVSSHVRVQIRGAVERLAALRADVWLDLSVAKIN